LPLITKQDIRRGFPGNFLPAGVELETLLELDLVELESTSGTSEERTPLLMGRGWWTAQEERALRLNRFVAGILDEFPEARRVTLGSPVCNGDICYRGVPVKADRIVGQALFPNLSRHPFLWSQADLARMAAETVEWQPQFLEVDPVYGVLFARYCEQQGIRLPSVQFILCSYEYVSVLHRRILQRAFGAPVFNLYGSTETGHLLMEDERGEMRPSLETAFLEVIEPDAGGVGELVVTTLTNEYMPLIRYRIGDLVQRQETSDGPVYRVHGRVADAFAVPAGERIPSSEISRLEPLNGRAPSPRPSPPMGEREKSNRFMGSLDDAADAHGDREPGQRKVRLLTSSPSTCLERVTTRQVDECFEGLGGMIHYQLLQRTDGRWLLRFAPDDRPPQPAEVEELRRRLARLLDIQNGLEVSPSETLLAESSGKFRLGYPTQARYG